MKTRKKTHKHNFRDIFTVNVFSKVSFLRVGVAISGIPLSQSFYVVQYYTKGPQERCEYLTIAGSGLPHYSVQSFTLRLNYIR